MGRVEMSQTGRRATRVSDRTRRRGPESRVVWVHQEVWPQCENVLVHGGPQVTVACPVGNRKPSQFFHRGEANQTYRPVDG